MLEKACSHAYVSPNILARFFANLRNSDTRKEQQKETKASWLKLLCNIETNFSSINSCCKLFWSITDFDGELAFRDRYICSMATAVTGSHFKILSQKINHFYGTTLGNGTLTVATSLNKSQKNMAHVKIFRK
jgi:hypothetical protein